MIARRRLTMVLGVVALVVAATLVALLNQDPDRYRPELSRLLSDAAGHPVTLEGPLTLRWRPSPAVTAEDVRIALPGASATLGSVEVKVDAPALLARTLRAQRIRVDGLRVDLAGSPRGGGSPGFPDFAVLPVDVLEIHDLDVQRDGARLLALDRITLSEPGAAQGARIDIAGVLRGAAVEGRARLRASGERLQLDALELHTPAGIVGGAVSLVVGGPRPRVAGELSANALTFDGEGAGAGAGARRVIPRVPVDLAALAQLDAGLQLRVGRLNLGGIRISDVVMPVTLQDGRLEASGRGVYAGGAADATLTASAADVRWTLDVGVVRADAGDALVMLGVTSAESGGRLDLDLALTALGAHTDAILGSLEGRIAADLADVDVRAGAARLAGADLFGTAVRALSGEDTRRISIECGVARFDVHAGVLAGKHAIGLQSRDINVLGGGRISLSDERLELVLRPWPREGLGLSASTLAGAVAIGGSLAQPEVGLTSEAAWRSGATAGAALLSGGLSLIAQGVLERARGDAPCAEAAGTAPQGGSAAGAAVDAASRAVRGVGDAIRGVFGGGSGAGGAERGGRADR